MIRERGGTREVWKTRIELDEKERGRQRERVLKCVGERETSERRRGGRKNRDGKESEKRKREKKRGVSRETEGTRTLFWEKRDHFLFP